MPVLLDNLDLTDKLNAIEEKALSIVDRATDKAFNVDDYIVNSISDTVGIRFSNWLSQHPLIAWLLNHPLIALVISLITAILVVRLVLTIYRAIASIIDRMWLAILRSPFTILKVLFGWEKKPETSISTTVTNYEVTNDSVKLQEIVTRLDLIQQQQQEIIRELALLKQQPLTIEPQQLRLVEKKIVSNQ